MVMLTVQLGAEANSFSEPTRADLPIGSFSLFTGIFFLFSLTTIIFFWQWVPYLNSALIGPPEDNMQDFWNTWYAAIAGNFNSFFFTDLIRFPEGTELYYHSFAYPKVFIIALIAKVIGADMTS